VQLKNEFEDLGKVKFLAKKLDLDSATVKDLLFAFGKELNNIVAVIGTNQANKAVVSIYISKDLVEQYDLHAGNLIREIAREIQGGGGGQAFFATAGGKNPNGLDKALQKAKELIKAKINS
jgi:alanyl-tRNA synthetase